MKNIPNYFTLLNLVFGCLAIVFTLQNGIMITVNSEGTDLLYIPAVSLYTSDAADD